MLHLQRGEAAQQSAAKRHARLRAAACVEEHKQGRAPRWEVLLLNTAPRQGIRGEFFLKKVRILAVTS